MSLPLMTGEQMRQAIDAAIKTLETHEIKEGLNLKIAADFNILRKINMIEALQQLYGWKHGNGKMPDTFASEAFNPYEGAGKSNIYYLFKELKKGMPWEIHRELLVVPIALTIVMFDIAQKLFPSPQVSMAKMNFQGFLNLLTLPVKRRGLSHDEEKEKREHYMHQLAVFEEKIMDSYQNLATYFAEIEDPLRNPVTNEIHETHKKTSDLARKYLKSDPPLSFVTQSKCYEIWNTYRSRTGIVIVNGRKRKVAYKDVFALCQTQLVRIGVKDANTFKLAVENYRRNTSKNK